MEAPDFWDDAEVSQKKMKELKSMKDDMEIYHSLESQMEDMETMIEMGYEENDPEIIPEIQEMLDEFQKNFDSIRVKKMCIRDRVTLCSYAGRGIFVPHTFCQRKVQR